MTIKHFVDINDAVNQCKMKAFSAGYEVFGVQVGIECYTGPRAHLRYRMHGEADNCVDGKGGWALSVYRIIKGMMSAYLSH